ncbi:sn-glycerol-3-phosphate ABC transporter substrate-binding protein UgpB [Caldisericum sp.]|uniref:sn-glycerol-3-phosphate ABC transporter substrate-binding protein UgpB n=1 Tax=Caldisericum sp. TaxID=2499687 RepID=UPI003D11B806
MKKIVIILLLLLVAIGLVNAQVPQGRVEIEFWFALRGPLGDATMNLVNDFNSSQDKYWVNAFYKGTYPEVMAAAIAAFRAGKAPHIVQIFEVGTATMMASEGAIYPIYQLFKDTGVSLNPQNYISAVKDYYSFPDGRMAAMPFNSSTAVMWYNKDAFRKAGLDPNKPPKTWDEVRKASRQIVKTGAAKIGLSASWLPWTQFEQLGAIHNVPFATRWNGFMGLDARLTLNHPLYVRHLQNLIEMQKEGSFTYGGRDAQPDGLFPSGEAAMLIASSALYGRVSKEAQFDWGITYLPYYDDVPKAPWNSIIGGAALWVMRRPDATLTHYKAVAEFLRFLSLPKNDAWWHMTTGYLPVTLEGYKYAKDQGYYKKNPGLDIPILQLTRTKPTPNTKGLRLGNLPSIRIVIYEEVEKALQGQQTAKDALNNIVLRGNAILREFEAIYKK